jgi:hypothetical protein
MLNCRIEYCTDARSEIVPDSHRNRMIDRSEEQQVRIKGQGDWFGANALPALIFEKKEIQQ